MVTSTQANAAVVAHAEFYALMVLAIVVLTAFLRLGPVAGGVVLVGAVVAFRARGKIVTYIKSLFA
jgi:hypothetical protein